MLCTDVSLFTEKCIDHSIQLSSLALHVHAIYKMNVCILIYGFACFAGVSGGIGITIFIAPVVIIVGCIIIKRRWASKRPGEWSKLSTTVLLLVGYSVITVKM